MLVRAPSPAGSPLCFVVIYPGWDDTPAYDLLMTSRFMQKLIVFEKDDHVRANKQQPTRTQCGAIVIRRGTASLRQATAGAAPGSMCTGPPVLT